MVRKCSCGLSELGVFLAIRRLVRSGVDTQEEIADKLGLYRTTGRNKGQPRREYIQVRVNLARLPLFVQEQYIELACNREYTPVRWGDVARLYREYCAEYDPYTEETGQRFRDLWWDMLAREKEE